MSEDGGWSTGEGDRFLSREGRSGDDSDPHQGGGSARAAKKGRALSTLVHTVLFLTASVGFTISFAMLGDEQPWALDLEATEEMLGIGKEQGGEVGESLEEWLSRLGGGEDKERLFLFVRMLYTCCAWSCLFVCTSIISITFLAPRNRPLVFVSQIVISLGASMYTHFFSVFLKGSKHRRTLHSLLVCNWLAVLIHIFDLYLRRRGKHQVAPGRNPSPATAKGKSRLSKSE
uniref:Uncharacterized protein n=1 Tax=Hemiselmis tepida TaxID=464990 RepID=A0A7S0YZH8_9CRYP|mmetsp:Transcript_32689/g.83661  ORF Transcript_32689/g.83661 Transcript_32689/m.83661 type:complete len:231 (+) Transcript_32689:489-1181(+)